MFDKTAANPTSDPSATPTSTTDPWNSITLGVTTTFGVFITCCILAAFIKCFESIIKMNRKSRNQDDRRPDEGDGRGRTSWPRRSSNSPILPTTHRPTNEGNDEDELNGWMRGASNRRQGADLRINLLEQKVEELYYAINKVQDDHDKLASVIEEIACEILSEVATMGNSSTETSSQYFSCKSNMQDSDDEFLKSGDISELPGTEELLGRATPSDQLDDYPIPNRPFRTIGGRTTPPPIPAKSSKRFVPYSPENPFLDPQGQRRTPHRFTSEFGKGSSRPTSPIPYIPPPRPPPHGSLAPAPNLNSNHPVSACAYFAPVEKKTGGPSAPRQQPDQANERCDGRTAWTSSSTSGASYRHGGEDREVRYRRPTSSQVRSSSSANDERRRPGHFDAATPLHADDAERGQRLPHGRHVGPGGFGTGDEALDALEWEYSPARGWTSRQPFSWSGADFADVDIDPSTPAQGQRARFDGRHWGPAQVDCGSSSSSIMRQSGQYALGRLSNGKMKESCMGGGNPPKHVV
ncbi:uncharacterized protein LTHEOB_6212 [Lasiodiplodia theobromae]|uniref:uncharacterized protein n=1 Tax=Lasiodiplodia theobromae TaxID=45133 RepID=UPI0015C3D854|nr:uncharacterized protein LTHEOB_6212 [Lasiodiplodia theobromae]KAF4544094.1 hypothetical protein LTHEOB_6212 [Lasiodiplodia theobromae]